MMSEAAFAREIGIEPANLKSLAQITRLLDQVLTLEQSKAVYMVKLRDMDVAYVASHFNVQPHQVNVYVTQGMATLRRHVDDLVKSRAKHVSSQKPSS